MNITTIVKELEKPGEQLWVRISNGRINVRLGVVYAPQESKTVKEKLKPMYQQIDEQINLGNINDQQVMVIGDLNAKVGDVIKGNKKQVTKGGRLMLETVKKFDLEIVNATEKCKGLWTREEHGQKSVLDYVLVNRVCYDAVKKMKIDEEKEITPYTKTGEGRTYTDHNTITVDMDWTTPYKAPKPKRTTLAPKAKERFKQKTMDAGLTKIWEEEIDAQKAYTTWNKKVKEIGEECFTSKKKKKQTNKTIRKLRKKKKELKDLMKRKVGEEKKIIAERRKLITEFINDIKRKQEASKVSRIAEKIRKEGGFDANAFWKHAAEMRGNKKETATAVKDEEGKIEEDPVKIKEIHRRYFEKLLKDRKPEGKDEIELEELKEKCIRSMEKATKGIEIKSVSKKEYETMKKQLKKKKAPDQEGWRYEWVESAGKDLEKSIRKMMNAMLKHRKPAEEWRAMRIKVTTKKKKKKMEMEFKRGLFLTNIISKCVEKILLMRRQDALMESMQPFQNGGTKGRGKEDNLFILNNVIEDYRERKENLYLLFADLEKCFDKLHLKDCIIEIVEAGVPVEEAMFIYQMNRNIVAEVDTPVGVTNKINIEEAVRQGTVLGPPLCGVSTNRLNKMGRNGAIVVNKTEIQAPIFVDDILGMGGKKQVENIGDKMRGLETTKKFQFNNDHDKTEVLSMKFSKKQQLEEIEIEVRKGKIERTESYKYLGDHYDETGSNAFKIEKRMEKSKYMAYEVKRMGSPKRVGQAAAEVRLFLSEMIVKPTLLSNVETWCKVGKVEDDLWRKHQYQIIRVLMEQRVGTPYWGIIAETGTWPYPYIVKYKMLMFAHNLINSDEKRIARTILIQQSQVRTSNYYNDIKKIAENLEIELDIADLQETKKSKWKQLLKDKIHKQVLHDIKEEVRTKTKMRFVSKQKFEAEEYIKKLTMKETATIMRLKLNMVETKANFPTGDDRRCIMCGEDDETTEHLFKCTRYRHLTGHNLVWDDNGKHWTDIQWMKEAVVVVERIEEIRKREMNRQ